MALFRRWRWQWRQIYGSLDGPKKTRVVETVRRFFAIMSGVVASSAVPTLPKTESGRRHRWRLCHEHDCVLNGGRIWWYGSVGMEAKIYSCRYCWWWHNDCRRWSRSWVSAAVVFRGKEEDEVRVRSFVLCVLLIKGSKFNLFFMHLHNLIHAPPLLLLKLAYLSFYFRHHYNSFTHHLCFN